MICSRSCTHQFYLSSTFNFNHTPIHNPQAFQMPPKTCKTTAASCNAPHLSHPSPPKTWKRTNSATGDETSQKKSKLSVTVEQESKGGRDGKIAKGKGQKGQKREKNKCAMHFLFCFFYFLFLLIIYILLGKKKLLETPRWALLQHTLHRKSPISTSLPPPTSLHF